MIGVFDSGLGGLSILAELRRALPAESFVFLGDGKRCPYGSRSREEVLRFTVEAVERLLAEGCTLIVLACNTATAVAVEYLRAKYPQIPFVGLEPAVKPAALSSRSGVIAVLATERSLRGELFLHTSAQFADRVKILKAVGEGFVEIVEQNLEDTPVAEQTVRRVVEPLIAQGADKIVLGCTHYPFLRKALEKVVEGHDVDIIDSSAAVARRTAQLLDQYGLRAPEGSAGSCRFITWAGDDYLDLLRKKAGE